MLPITEQERDYKVEFGIEALESLFEENEIEYWRAERDSVV
jgi:hypothetical protein